MEQENNFLGEADTLTPVCKSGRGDLLFILQNTISDKVLK